MAAANFSVIRVGESVWTTWEPEDGVFDLEWLAPVLDGAHARDIGVILGTPTYAAGPGVVVQAGPAASYGTLVVIDHGSGVLTRYAHMWNQDVLTPVGTTLTGGQVIGRVGSNGDSTGCHLHLEVVRAGERIDPGPFLRSVGVTL